MSADTTKPEPEFTNATGARLLVSEKNGSSFWLNPGEKVKGERWRAYRAAGLVEVKTPTFPANAAKPSTPNKTAAPTVVAPTKEQMVVEDTSLLPDQTNLGTRPRRKNPD